MISFEHPAHVDASPAREARDRYRNGAVEPTGGVARGFTQANMIASGVIPQAAVMASGVPFAITHAPGYMFIPDIPVSAYHA